jgi:hypothetical protein
MSEGRRKITKDGLVPGNPRKICGIRLFDRLVIDCCGDVFHWRHLIANQEVLKLRSLKGRQDLSAPKGVIGFSQLLTDSDIEDGGYVGGNGGGGRRSHDRQYYVRNSNRRHGSETRSKMIISDL